MDKERKYNIGDLVFAPAEGLKTQFEVIRVYPLEAGETHFFLKKISNINPYEFGSSERMYCIEYFKPLPWFMSRQICFEKYGGKKI